MRTIDKNSRGLNYLTQLGIFIGLIGAGLIVGTLISAGVWVMMTGRSILNMPTDMLKPEFYNATMILQALSTFLYFFVPVFGFAAICYRKPAKFIGFNTNINIKQVFIVIAILVLTFPLSGALAELNKIIPLSKHWTDYFTSKESERTSQEAALININSFSRYIFSLIIVALLPALFEEVVFRGGLQNLLTKWFNGPVIAIIITSILFSLVHLSYYGFLVRFALGAILGIIFYVSGSIWLSVLFHFLYNGLQVTVLYATHTAIADEKNQKDIESNFPVWAGIIALAIIIYLLLIFKKISSAQKSKIVDTETEDDFSAWDFK